MTMRPAVRKAALTVHVFASVGWMGALAAFAALAVTGAASDDDVVVRGVTLAMGPLTSYVILPLAFGAFASGLVQSLGTPWGLVRHWWVVIKLLVTAVALVVLVLQLDTLDRLTSAARRGPLGAEFDDGRASMVLHSVAGLALLVLPMVLSVFKPKGLTSYGARKASAAR